MPSNDDLLRRNTELEHLLREANSKLENVAVTLEHLKNEPTSLGFIQHTWDPSNFPYKLVSIYVDGATRIFKTPKHMKIPDGTCVGVLGGLITGGYPMPANGVVTRVAEVLTNRVLVDLNGQLVSLTCGTKVNVGDRVIVHPSAGLVLGNLGPVENVHGVSLDHGVTWEAVGGQEEAKAALREAIEVPYQHAKLYKSYGMKGTKGVLIYGPPGCGKTLLGKAVSRSLADVHGQATAGSGFIYVKGPEILSKWVGDSEAAVRALFDSARRHKEAHGYPAVIFIDEADAVLNSRSNSDLNRVASTLVPMFLTEMDGLQESSAVVLLATNRPDSLDPAVVREGRIDRKVKISRPTKAVAKEIFQIHLTGRSLGVGLDAAELAASGAEELFKDSHALFHVKTSNGTRTMTLGHIASGAMIANICEQATTAALRRDIAAKARKASGVRAEDLAAAIQTVRQESRHTNHRESVTEFVTDFRNDVVDVIPALQ